MVHPKPTVVYELGTIDGVEESTYCTDEFVDEGPQNPDTFFAGNFDTAVNLLLCAFQLALNLESITNRVLNLFGSMALDENAPILNFVVRNWTQLFNVLLSFVYSDDEWLTNWWWWFVVLL
jgi:hypothetical protein